MDVLNTLYQQLESLLATAQAHRIRTRQNADDSHLNYAEGVVDGIIEAMDLVRALRFDVEIQQEAQLKQ